MTKEELKAEMEKKESIIHEEIKNFYQKSVGLDGIVSIDDYLDINNPDSNPLKILWVLKERAYPSDEAFYVRECIKYPADNPKWYKTFKKMCYVTAGILEWQNSKDDKHLSFENQFKLEVDEEHQVYYKSPQPFLPLNHIAFLNIKKLNSQKRMSNPVEIQAEYAKPEVKKILREQFDYINPDIIIFGAHVTKIAEDFAGISFSEYTHFGEDGAHDYYFDQKKNKLFIYADHPARIISNNKYCNSIFNVIKIFKNELLR
ncbi:MAG: hypothetical protein SPL22_12410 [Treponema sp.]|uniref:hypothetical protein n=1 Tax=Treponema sp. TaxID=166 RepID=UPI002A91287F|nr:hypothetical protein [Treponema sp.]MDY6398517.1 hypothetical protein [Treponema sp.]